MATITNLVGDVTGSGRGAVTTTIANLAVTNAKIANATIDLTTKVTGALPIGNGGTGQTTANPAFNALSPLTTKGDLVAYSTVNARLPVGSNGQVLTADSTQTLGVKWSTPSGSLPDSQIVLYTGNATPMGSSATKIRRFATTGTNIGSGMTLTQNSTDGTYITINTAGIYIIEYTDRTNSGTANFFGVSLNATGGDLTTDIGSLAAAKILQQTRSGEAGGSSTQGDGPCISITARLAVNDVIRPHTDGSQDNIVANFSRFSITQIVIL